MNIDVLLIGHITKDVLPDGSDVPGGSVYYCSAALSRLGLRTAVVTSAGFADENSMVCRKNWSCKPSAETTTFRNITLPGGRQQYLLARASTITVSDIPDQWLKAPSVIICPVAQEIEPDLAQAFPDSLVMIILQGLMRSWNQSGLVFPRTGGLDGSTDGTRIAVVSNDDIGENDEALTELSASPHIAIITSGSRGCMVRQGSEIRSIPAKRAREIDSVGAGDVFAAAFLYSYRDTGDAFAAAHFASAAAAIFVESPGATAMPDLRAIEARERTSRSDVR